ncbi:unnamed protein product [Fraxinus pennsylvanica]|uniref:Uncharacterized protein n=1 Tax=Fraxinus pennsylvanica TaxID=56036 RepID=A0AAD1YV97_9LAMI|nr:unnamed protein product [Fraxinus pennsylvanica]
MFGSEEGEGESEDSGSEKNDTAEEEELEVSLNTLANSVNPRIFRIMAKHRIESWEVLIDTGSNNNFIQEALVEKMGLNWEETRQFKVYMGNGHYLFTIEYKAGKENSAAEPLSRRHEKQNIQLRAAISAGRYDLLLELRQENMKSPELQELQKQVLEGTGQDNHYSL